MSNRHRYIHRSSIFALMREEMMSTRKFLLYSSLVCHRAIMGISARVWWYYFASHILSASHLCEMDRCMSKPSKASKPSMASVALSYKCCVHLRLTYILRYIIVKWTVACQNRQQHEFLISLRCPSQMLRLCRSKKLVVVYCVSPTIVAPQILFQVTSAIF